jgi:hypothetical protein
MATSSTTITEQLVPDAVWVAIQPLLPPKRSIPRVGDPGSGTGRCWPASSMSYELHGTGVVHGGDLGALAMHVHADVDIHQGLGPRARLVPEAEAVGLSRGRDPTRSVRS